MTHIYEIRKRTPSGKLGQSKYVRAPHSLSAARQYFKTSSFGEGTEVPSPKGYRVATDKGLVDASNPDTGNKNDKDTLLITIVNRTGKIWQNYRVRRRGDLDEGCTYIHCDNLVHPDHIYKNNNYRNADNLYGRCQEHAH